MRDLLRTSALRDDQRRRTGDPLLHEIVWDLLTTTAGFLLVVTAVVLSVQGLSAG